MNVRAGRALRSVAVAALLVQVAACTVLQDPQQRNLRSTDAVVRDCAQWFGDADARIDAAGVRDAEDSRVAGFPYLRSNRFLASFRNDVAADSSELRAWISHMRDADLLARGVELRALSPATVDETLAVVQRCGDLLSSNDLADPATIAALRERVQVPDAYLDWQRVVGLYALTRIPFASGVAQWQEETQAMFAQARGDAPSPHPAERYGPSDGARYARAEVAALLARGEGRPLGIPPWSAAEQAKLLATHAPVFEVATSGVFDRPGALVWRGAGSPDVDVNQPVVYQRIAFTRYGGRTLVQLVYTIWFSERPADHAFDMLAGKLDGLVWRVTLAPDGEPILFDTMHPCGCFHMFLPTSSAVALPAPDPADEWVFVPTAMPRVSDGERVLLRLTARSHYLIGAGVLPAGSSAPRSYDLVDEQVLRSLPLPGGGFRSVYGADALVPGTERPERLLFWPMGIPSAGAMRQWGSHATAFVGRRHFDDADLIERRFRLKFD